MKIISVVGARPQFIKLSQMDRAFDSRQYEHMIVHTGQHYDYELSRAFFDQLNITEPHYNLEIGSSAHGRQTGQMLEKLETIFSDNPPDLVLVYGDTNSTLAGALAAVKLHIPVGHVEAGYRSGDMSMPEEVNRVVTDRVAQILFAPTQDAIDNLLAEGHKSERIFFVGNIMAEALLSNLEVVRRSTIVEDMGLEPRGYAVLTIHRPENTNDGKRLSAIIEGILATDYPVIFPVHPRTRTFLKKYKLEDRIGHSHIRLIEPLTYMDFTKLEADARMILTDSGGIQEEAILLGVPCLTLRYNTERTVTLGSRANQLVGADAGLIHCRMSELRDACDIRFVKPPKWDTAVTTRIIEAIESFRKLTIEPEVIELS